MNRIKLNVNDADIDIDRFTTNYIYSVLNGILDAIKTPSVRTETRLTVIGKEVDLVVNGEMIPLNPFTNRIVLSTVSGTVSPLKGVVLPIHSIVIDIT